MGLRARFSRLGRDARSSPSVDPRSLARRRPAHGGPGDGPRDCLQRRNLQFPRPSTTSDRRGAGDAVHRRHRRDAARAWPAWAGSGGLAARHVRLRLLGPQETPAPRGQGSAWDQAALSRAAVRTQCGLVAGLRFGASRAARVRSLGHASPRSAGGGQLRVERLRRRLRHGGAGRRTPVAWPPHRVRRRGQGGPQPGLLAHVGPVRPIRSPTRKVWPQSSRRA